MAKHFTLQTLPVTESPEPGTSLDDTKPESSTELPDTNKPSSKEEESVANMETTVGPTTTWPAPSTRGVDKQNEEDPTIVPDQQLHSTTEPSELETTKMPFEATKMPFEAPKVTTVETLQTTVEPLRSEATTTKLVEVTTTLPPLNDNSLNSEAVTEMALDTTTVIATSISTSEAIVYFNPAPNQSETKSEESSLVFKLF